MIDQFVSVFNFIYPYLLFILVGSLILVLITGLIFKYNKNEEAKLKIYGVLFDSSSKQILSLALILLRFLFLLAAIFFTHNNYFCLVFIIIVTVLYNVLNFRVVNVLIDLFNTGIIYLIILSKDVFFDYYINVFSAWYVMVLLIVACLFLIVYSFYSLLSEFYYIIRKNGYIKQIEKI